MKYFITGVLIACVLGCTFSFLSERYWKFPIWIPTTIGFFMGGFGAIIGMHYDRRRK